MTRRIFTAMITIVGSEVGGRQSPIYPKHGQYRPHAIARGDSEMLGVAFINGPEQIAAGETAEVEMEAMYYPNVNYRKLTKGTQFIIVEGYRIVAVGRINAIREEI
jgi:translation elongation factor EF-Tu-like GTPase